MVEEDFAYQTTEGVGGGGGIFLYKHLGAKEDMSAVICEGIVTLNQKMGLLRMTVY
jgi:hypothetical protein